ncbi:hypothetical protein P175DRAFT_0542298 [Aspergillus ochraceoroseus IBT 24754]|uniref:FAD-binding PCMH-type domain-containing protein n=3 Tax=Aspergillus subgen. Nidulantes TaxID=2720870 RepID=A0A0F8VDA5_9EURO|nr:uncharacterized protein P175DRAFT_0542298 [Aspergillus ochraceoroseus IBT 24754]KKK12760.1 hypothetical protein AOCH_006542 [Aspergillus ochraceoroseus]KKK21076.1 hypothetical protein ARAM_004309 [Aspergillus rambellii]PTU22452.1 hypothetical protein P175DRAFT_0542298 [Aspergillus ochraceoroseus IBT 24754]
MKVCANSIVSVLDTVLKTCPANGSVSACCVALKSTSLSDRVFYPTSDVYHQSIGSYWRADNQQLYPSCVVQPHSAQDVSLAVSTLVKANDNSPRCQFAVRSGGHGTVTGSTNGDYAVTIDLSQMNQTVYHADTCTASIQAGARWKSVYKTLSQHNMAVPGGRSGMVGVGGFVTGGGNSFHSAQYGLVCDAVVNFEIVLANGQITTANEHTNPDLFKVLRGGSNNFGIVTRIDLEAFEQESLWGGVVTYNQSTAAQQIPAFVDFTSDLHKDPHASLIALYTYSSELGVPVISNALEYTKPVEFPAAFARFYALPNISSTMRIADLDDVTSEFEPPGGVHHNFFTLTFANDPRILHRAVEIQTKAIEEIKHSVKSSAWSIMSLYQPFPALFTHLVDLLWFTWDEIEDTPLFDSVGYAMVEEIESYARSRGGGNRYIYLNYAAGLQNPLRGYGEDNLREMRRVAEKYDPLGVFQYQVPGGFKLSQA